MVIIIRQPATAEQLNLMAETFWGLRIKLAVDVAREILAVGERTSLRVRTSFIS